MLRTKLGSRFLGCASLAVTALATLAALGQDRSPLSAPAPAPLPESSSYRAQTGLAHEGPGSKYVIEQPTKQLLAKETASSPPAESAFVNPKVQPGLVTWHATFADACQAARRSGKPVLLFQMMGKLDDQFC